MDDISLPQNKSKRIRVYFNNHKYTLKHYTFELHHLRGYDIGKERGMEYNQAKQDLIVLKYYPNHLQI